MSRTLTVSTLFRRVTHTAHLSSMTRNARVPHLRLTGQWLERAGFPPGARVAVHVVNGQLVITCQP